jgi:Zn-dependent protease with chaperone function
VLYQLLFAFQIALAWYFALSLITAIVFAAAGPLVRAWLPRRHASNRPLGLRLLPSAASLAIVGACVVPAFALLEPYRSTAGGERLGSTALLFAAGGFGIFAVSITRGLKAVCLTRRRMRDLYASSTTSPELKGGAKIFISDSPANCVVLDGLIKPRLLVSRTVLQTLTAEEFEGAVAHELAHHRAHDNAKRRLLAFTPDLVSTSSLARDLEFAWKHAAEVEADAAAVQTEAQAVALASALVKVARLADGKPRIDLGRAAFHDGAPVADRIRALCMRERSAQPPSRRLRLLFGTAAVAPALAWLFSVAPILPTIHRLTEWLVHLP